MIGTKGATMNKKYIVTIFYLCLVLLSNNAFGQKEEFRDPNKRPKDFLVPVTKKTYMKTKEYEKAHERLEKDFWWLYEAKEKRQILAQNKTLILKIIKSNKDFGKIERARYWCAKNPTKIIPDLIGLLENGNYIGLEGYYDLIILDRVISKDMPFYGHGWVVGDDLFLVAGRASWILREITGRWIGVVRPKSSPDELKLLSESWAEWYQSQSEF